MSVVEEITDRGLGIPLGVGALVAAVSAGPALVRVGRPVIKHAIKGYLVLHAKTREMFAETAENLQDLYAEAKHEYSSETEAGEKESQSGETEEPKAEGGAKRGTTRKAKPKEESV